MKLPSGGHWALRGSQTRPGDDETWCRCTAWWWWAASGRALGVHCSAPLPHTPLPATAQALHMLNAAFTGKCRLCCRSVWQLQAFWYNTTSPSESTPTNSAFCFPWHRGKLLQVHTHFPWIWSHFCVSGPHKLLNTKRASNPWVYRLAPGTY